MQHYFATQIVDGYIELLEEDKFHLLKVMRMQNGDEIVAIFDAHKYLCIVELKSNELKIRIKHEIEGSNELNTDITLIYSMPKGDKFELVLQKATELGVKRIVPLISERSLIKFNNAPHKIERWQRIIKEASEQSRRNIIPEILEPIQNKDIKYYLSELNLIGNENFSTDNTASLAKLVQQLVKSITVIVGCEGGFSQEEFSLYESLGVKSVSFGRRILRSETAAIYILSVLSFICEK